MIRVLLLCLILMASPLAAQVAIRGGEHAEYTRLVIQLGDFDEIALTQQARVITLEITKPNFDLTTRQTFDRIPRTRISDVDASTSNNRATATIQLACDCPTAAYTLNDGVLVLDIYSESRTPNTPANASSIPIQTSYSTAGLQSEQIYLDPVVNAQKDLLRQLTRAVDQGFLSLTSKEETTAATDLPDINATMEQLAMMLEQSPGLEVRTALDRPGIVTATPDEDQSNRFCLPDKALDISSWETAEPFPAQLAALRSRILGEFDEVDIGALDQLVRLYVRFGFGVEARAMMTTFDFDIIDKNLLWDLSFLVEGYIPNPTKFVSNLHGCPSFSGLWYLAGTPNPALPSNEDQVTIINALASIPSDMRSISGDLAVSHLIEIGRYEFANELHSLVARTGNIQSHRFELNSARLMLHSGRIAEGESLLQSLSTMPSVLGADAKVAFVNSLLDRGAVVSAAMRTELGALETLFRNTHIERRVDETLVRVAARNGDLDEALYRIDEFSREDGLDDFARAQRKSKLFLTATAETVGASHLSRAVISNYGDLLLLSGDAQVIEHLGFELRSIGLTGLATDLEAGRPLENDDISGNEPEINAVISEPDINAASNPEPTETRPDADAENSVVDSAKFALENATETQRILESLLRSD